MTSRRWIFPLVVVAVFSLPIWAQPVVSARSGLIHFSEGSVFLDGQRVQHTFGRFDQMKDGSELRTEDGRVEVMLTPGTFLRLGEGSSIRMVSSHHEDTRVELLHGSGIVESQNGAVTGPVTIIQGDYRVQFLEPGRYRIDSAPGQLKVESGRAEVFRDDAPVTVDAGDVLPFAGILVPEKSGDQPADALDNWNQARTSWIAQSNNDIGNATDLSAAMENWQNDPDAYLRALGSSAYIPPLGYTSPSYAPLSSYGVRPPYGPWPGPGMSTPYFGVLGIGGVSPLFIYPRPTFGYRPYTPSSSAGSSAFPWHGALGAGRYYRPPSAVRPVRPSYGGTGRAAGHR